jgi:uncharacterized protein YcsI (UPF0317 family)
MSPLGFDDLQDLGPAALRAVFRTGRYDGPTTGFAPGKLQCNLVILPEASARSFVTYCERNPAPCPLVSVGETGNPNLEPLGQDIDVRTDLPAYHLHRQDSEQPNRIATVSACHNCVISKRRCRVPSWRCRW